MKNKYNIGDIIVETCFKYEKDYRTGYVTDIKELIHKRYIIVIKWFDIEQEDVLSSDMLERMISRNNAKHYQVSNEK
jgi:hypothetical protein